MKTVAVLVLEDHLPTLSVITATLGQLEEELYPQCSLVVTVYSTYQDVEELVNPQGSNKYDIILLDRDCKLAGSFHVLDIEKFGSEKVIAISMVPIYNEEASLRGVQRIITKVHAEPESFALQLREQVLALLRQRP